MQVSFTGSVVSSRPSFNTLNTDNRSNASVSMQTQPQNDEFKRITKGQIRDIKKYPQFARSDCYLVASLKSLAKSGFGKQMLKNSVSSNQDRTAFNVQFKRYENTDKDTYNVHKNDEDSSIAFEVATGRPDFRTIGAVEKATSDMNGEKSDAKPWYLKVFNKYGTNLEGNQASYFMRNLTGVEPISIGDEGLMPLSYKNKEKATKLLDKIGEFPMNRHSFVAGSKIMGTKNVGSSHYYVLNKVDNKEKKVYLRDPRYSDLSQEDMQQYIKDSCKIDSRIDTEKKAQKAIDKAKSKPKEICLSYDDFMKDFRSIVGYFDKKVVKNYDVNQEQ